VHPQWLIVIVVVRKGCSDMPNAIIDRIGHIPHHLGSILNAIELPYCVHSHTKIGYFVAQIRRLYCLTKGIDLLASLQEMQLNIYNV
jgi:hypothetical protein